MRKFVLFALALSVLAIGCGSAEDPKTTAPVTAGSEEKSGSKTLPEDR